MTDYQTSISRLKCGQYILINDMPCKIIELNKIHIGKIGGNKYIVKAVNIFTDKEELKCYHDGWEYHDHNVIVPEIKCLKYCLIGIDDNGDLELFDEETNQLIYGYKLPKGELGEKIKTEFNSKTTEMLSVSIKCYKENKIIYGYCSKKIE